MVVIFFPGCRERSRCDQVLEHFGGQELVAEAAVNLVAAIVATRTAPNAASPVPAVMTITARIA